jgi:hypothetical protein
MKIALVGASGHAQTLSPDISLDGAATTQAAR